MNIADYIKNKLPFWPNHINLFLLKINIFRGYVYGKKYRKICSQVDKVSSEQRLLESVNFAIQNVTYYRKRYGNIHITSKKEFEETIRFIDKDEVMAHWDEFIVDNIDWNKCIKGTTGGTSGKPLCLVTPKDRYAHSLAFWHKELKWFGWNYDTRGVIRNHHLPANRDYMVNPIMKEIIFDAFRIDAVYAKTIWKMLRKHNVKFIHAYPSAFFQFLKICKEQNLDVSFIKTCFLASEGVTDVQKHFIQDQMGITIYSFYGHSEKLIMAGNCPNCEDYHIEEAYGYCELVNEKGEVIKEPGVMGEMVGTTFTNKYFPLIRYKTGDFSSYSKNASCSTHGYKYRLLHGVAGRWDKSLIHRIDGTTTSVTALNLHSEFYEHIDGIQYVQDRVGQLKVLIIKNNLYTDHDESYLKRHLADAMKSSDGIFIVYTDRLIFQENGKFLPLISKLNY